MNQNSEESYVTLNYALMNLQNREHITFSYAKQSALPPTKEAFEEKVKSS
jgi:hypothetical protein